MKLKHYSTDRTQQSASVYCTYHWESRLLTSRVTRIDVIYIAYITNRRHVISPASGCYETWNILRPLERFCCAACSRHKAIFCDRSSSLIYHCLTAVIVYMIPFRKAVITHKPTFTSNRRPGLHWDSSTFDWFVERLSVITLSDNNNNNNKLPVLSYLAFLGISAGNLVRSPWKSLWLWRCSQPLLIVADDRERGKRERERERETDKQTDDNVMIQ